MKVYHSSPNKNIKILYDNSYVTLYPHIAYYMGLYYKNTNETWSNDDLEVPYSFGEKIIFKKNKKPNGKPTLYECNIESKNIILHKHFPFEFTIKKGVKCKKIPSNRIDALLKKSIKYSKLTDEINF